MADQGRGRYTQEHKCWKEPSCAICYWEVTTVSQKVSKKYPQKSVPKNCPKISVPKKVSIKGAKMCPKKESQKSVPANQVQPLWYPRCYCHRRWFLFFLDIPYSLSFFQVTSHNLALFCKLIQLLSCISNTGTLPLLFANKLFLHSFSVCVVMKLLQFKL